MSSKPGIYTKYKPMLTRDKTILRKLSKGNHPKRPPEVQNAILRRHMVELTQSFMIPLVRKSHMTDTSFHERLLFRIHHACCQGNYIIIFFLQERYVASLMPLQKSISPWKRPPRLKPFDVEEFLGTLDQAGPQLTSKHKGNWILLYRRFFKSPNFEGWLLHRQREIVQKLKVLHLEALGLAVSISNMTMAYFQCSG